MDNSFDIQNQKKFTLKKKKQKIKSNKKSEPKNQIKIEKIEN